MSVTELLQSTQFVIDAEGHKKAVMVDLGVWEELLTMLEDVEDAAEIERLRVLKDESISWEQAKQELKDKGINLKRRI